ncbi:hypothetical protein [Paraburkholderia sp. BR10954]|uniref:hypothetical protein n=1 Tax=Paraburkholderia sp. BR10954 TaxID=3236995 RepID=UPI0034D21894
MAIAPEGRLAFDDGTILTTLDARYLFQCLRCGRAANVIICGRADSLRISRIAEQSSERARCAIGYSTLNKGFAI